jgi:phosphatidylglycerophosphate synthase
MAGLPYSVRDRSVLLPSYKRFFVEPLIKFLPRSLDPNAITHAGHLINFVGLAIAFTAYAMGVKGGWAFAVAALCLHLYNWCDNADGAHARRTGRTSAMGELLDHGLDVLNVTYIACLSAIGIGAPPLAWIAIVIVIPLACSATYWEQAETGVFQLGALNQVESVVTLSIILVTSALFGSDVFDALRVGPVSVRLAMIVFVCSTSLVGILRNLGRVAKARGAASLAPIVALLAVSVLALTAATLGAISAPAAVIVATGANVFFGVQCLARRTEKRRPRSEPALLALVVLLCLLLTAGLAAHGVSTTVNVCVSTVTSIVFGVLAAASARAAMRAVAELDREAAAGDIKA